MMLVQSVFYFFFIEMEHYYFTRIVLCISICFLLIPDVFTIYNIPFSFEKFRYGK